jgi:hypothetical protein
MGAKLNDLGRTGVCMAGLLPGEIAWLLTIPGVLKHLKKWRKYMRHIRDNTPTTYRSVLFYSLLLQNLLTAIQLKRCILIRLIAFTTNMNTTLLLKNSASSYFIAK